jgi:hypothetical protein
MTIEHLRHESLTPHLAVSGTNLPGLSPAPGRPCEWRQQGFLPTGEVKGWEQPRLAPGLQ